MRLPAHSRTRGNIGQSPGLGPVAQRDAAGNRVNERRSAQERCAARSYLASCFCDCDLLLELAPVDDPVVPMPLLLDLSLPDLPYCPGGTPVREVAFSLLPGVRPFSREAALPLRPGER